MVLQHKVYGLCEFMTSHVSVQRKETLTFRVQMQLIRLLRCRNPQEPDDTRW